MTDPHSPWRRAVTVVVATLLGGGAAGWITWPDRSSPTDPPARTGEVQRELSVGDEPRPPTVIRRSRRAPEAGVPTMLRVPALDLRLPVRPEGVDAAGAMALPDTVAAAGWYRYGPRPGAEAGAAVIAGHVDTAEEGVGPLAALVGLGPGDVVSIDSARGTVDYTVATVATIAREDLDLDRLFARGGSPRLHLVTCGGAYLPEAGGYQSNVVVVAVPDGADRDVGLS